MKPKEEHAVKVCVSLSPAHLKKAREIQGKYILKHDRAMSVSRILNIALKNGLKAIKQKDLEK